MPDKQSRRGFISLGTAAGVVALSGCVSVTASDQPSQDTSTQTEVYKPPTPEIRNATAEITNFTQTENTSITYVLMQNTGQLGEFELTVEAKGEAVIYDSDTTTFSLEAKQEVQLKAELYTHEGAEEIVIEAAATDDQQRVATYTITQDDTENIDYTAESA